MKHWKMFSLLLFFGLMGPQIARSSDLTDRIIKLSQQRLRAYAAGDRATLQRIVADDAIFLYSDGRTLNKSQMLSELAPFPNGFELRFEDVQVREFRDSVMLCFRLVYQDPTGISAEPLQYLETDTFALRKGRWLLIGVHGTAVPYPTRHEAALSPALLDEYAGQYQVGDQHYAITREGDQLFGQRSGFSKVRWYAESENVFFVDGDTAGRRIFIRNKTGQVSQMMRVGAEHYVVWTRVPESATAKP